jgi:hypothetical protein
MAASLKRGGDARIMRPGMLDNDEWQGRGEAQPLGRLDHVQGKEELLEILCPLRASLEDGVVDWKVLV